MTTAMLNVLDSIHSIFHRISKDEKREQLNERDCALKIWRFKRLPTVYGCKNDAHQIEQQEAESLLQMSSM